MDELMKNGELKISSREIAELTGKEHKNILRDIREMENDWVKIGRLKFELTSYKDEWNREQPEYQLTKLECLYIASKFDNEIRGKLVLRWEELEKEKRSPKVIDTYSQLELLKIAVSEIEKRDQLIEVKDKEIARLKPMEDFVEKAFSSDSLISMSEVAKVLNAPKIGRNKLFKLLKDKGILFGQNQPKQIYVNRKYFVLKEVLINMGSIPVVKTQVYVTQKGLDFIRKVLFETNFDINEETLSIDDISVNIDGFIS